MRKRNCWLRFKRHKWCFTTGFRFAPPPGWVIRCTECGRETTTIRTREELPPECPPSSWED